MRSLRARFDLILLRYRVERVSTDKSDTEPLVANTPPASGATDAPKIDPRLTKDAEQKANELFSKIFGEDTVVTAVSLSEYERILSLLVDMYENSSDRAMKQLHRQEGRILRALLANIDSGVKTGGYPPTPPPPICRLWAGGVFCAKMLIDIS